MFISSSPEETFTAGEQCGRLATCGDFFALTGELGAGKTQFVKGFVIGVGSDAPVTSPTFTLVHEYAGGRCPVYHFDFYRLDSADAVLRIGFDDYLDGDGICIVEWADLFPAIVPSDARWIRLDVASETERRIEGHER